MPINLLKSDDYQDQPENPGYFALAGGVGREAANDRADVIKVQTLLTHAGYLDPGRLDGPTGWYGKPLELAIRRYQKDNGLTVDGVMLPGGETVAALQQAHGPAFRGLAAPSAATVDDHYARRARGEPGLLDTDRNSDRPFGVAKLPMMDMRKPEPVGMRTMLQRYPDPDPLILTNRSDARRQPAAGDAGIELAQFKGFPRYGLPPAGGAPPVAPSRGPIPPIRIGPRRKQPLEKYDDFLAQNRIALHEGIRNVFGDITERRESDNTRLSSDIIVKECNDVIRKNVPLGNFTHVAGASEDGEGRAHEMGEWAVKDEALRKGGGGHSFPDILYMDEKTGAVVAINSATESAPGKYTPREVNSFDRLVKNLGEAVAEITGKKRPDESLEDYTRRARAVCEEAFRRHVEKHTPQDGDAEAAEPGRQEN